jgi:hypothetical protein
LACLAEDIDGRARLVLRQKGFGIQFVEWNRFCPRYMRTGIFWRRADIEQLLGTASAEKRRQRGGRDGFLLDFCLFL